MQFVVKVAHLLHSQLHKSGALYITYIITANTMVKSVQCYNLKTTAETYGKFDSTRTSRLHASMLWLIASTKIFLSDYVVDIYQSARSQGFRLRARSPPLCSAFFCFFFYSAAALLAMQSAVIPTAIPSVCLAVCLSHAGTLSRWMNIGSRGLHCEVAKTL